MRTCCVPSRLCHSKRRDYVTMSGTDSRRVRFQIQRTRQYGDPGPRSSVPPADASTAGAGIHRDRLSRDFARTRVHRVYVARRRCAQFVSKALARPISVPRTGRRETPDDARLTRTTGSSTATSACSSQFTRAYVANAR